MSVAETPSFRSPVMGSYADLKATTQSYEAFVSNRREARRSVIRKVLGAFFLLAVSLAFTSGGAFVSDVRTNATGYPDLYEASIAELQSGLDSARFTSVDLVKASSYILKPSSTVNDSQLLGLLRTYRGSKLQRA